MCGRRLGRPSSAVMRGCEGGGEEGWCLLQAGIQTRFKTSTLHGVLQTVGGQQ
jgi:hypothetical protein